MLGALKRIPPQRSHCDSPVSRWGKFERMLVRDDLNTNQYGLERDRNLLDFSQETTVQSSSAGFMASGKSRGHADMRKLSARQGVHFRRLTKG